MIIIKKFISGLMAFLILSSCSKEDEKQINLNDQNYLIFGHFYGQCIGEDCVETFKLTNNSLFEDKLDDYSGKKMEFIELDNEIFERVKNLTDFFPNQLLNEDDIFFGCPDCADQGGLFIQYSEDGNKKSWRIDQNKDNVPSYLHIFIDKMNEKIDLINN